MAIIIVYIIICLIIGYIADGSNLGFWSGFLLSILLTPLVGFIICLLYPAKKDNKQPIINAPSLSDELQKLKNLKDSGHLTDSEYTAAKAKLLNK